MKSLRHSRLRTVLVLFGLLVAVGLVPQFAHSGAVSAQTSTGTPGTTTPGTVTATVDTTATAVAAAAATSTAAAAAATSTATPATTPVAATTAVAGATLFTVCGPVTQFVAATATAPGTLNIAGLNITVATGTVFGGAAITTGGVYCAQITFNSSGQVASAILAASSTPTPSLNVCGPVTTFTAATSTTAGQIIIAGQSFSIAPGVTITGATPTTGGTLCFAGFLNSTSQLTVGSLTAPLSAAPVGLLDGAGGYRVGKTYND